MNDTKKKPEKDFLWLNIRELPYFRGVLRAVEARFYQEYDLPSPVFDLGCGDGQFTTVTFDRKLDVGLDPWAGPVRQAAEAGGYQLVVQGNGDRIPCSDRTFASAISNSVLEHIPDLAPVLQEVNRILKPGALFLFCVPNHNFVNNLSVGRFLDRLGLHRLAAAYRRFFNRISRHHHCDAPEVWQERMENAGFAIEKYWHYFSPKALSVLEWGHYFGLPSLISRKLFGKWILVPQPWNLALTRKIVEPAFAEESEQPQGSYTFYVCRKKG